MVTTTYHNTNGKTMPVFKAPKTGLHRKLFTYACECAEQGIPPEDCLQHLKACVDGINYYREVPEREIIEAVKCAYRCVLEGPSEDSVRLPRYDSSAANEIYQQWKTTIEDLREASIETPPIYPLEALQALFQPDELICMASRLEMPSIVPYNRLQIGVACCRQFMVPNPMKGKVGLTKDGKPSKRCTDNTGPRKRIVCDFDLPRPAMQPSLVAYLADYSGLDPEWVLHSGNKSLQAAWNCRSWSLEDILTFEEEAVRVGADPAIMGDGRRCQFVRMPAGYRDNGKRQVIHFWNPNPTGNE
ncbi:hypothetical protein N9H94_03040 [Akkermansiaceae bacterium]|nr:hypothetical protein [Akkermansiaceae bacterium]MDB4546511.1 hypothetical protein [Akkermansiaceae bacterium]